MNELVSVIMPAYNASRYVREAVDSVLAQTYPSIELIAIDDGSTDDTRSILESYANQLTLVALDANQGIAAARNAGLAKAQGAYIAFMDADDIWEPEKIVLQMKEFAAQPELELLFTHMRCFISPELPEEVKQLRQVPEGNIPGYVPPTAMMRRYVFDRIGVFDPKWRVGEFIDWWSRAKDAGVVSDLLPDVLLHRRIHDTNTGVVARDSRVDYARIIRESLKRRSAQS